MQSTSNVQKYGLRISDISCNGLPHVGRVRFLQHSGSFYIAATIAGVTRRTHLAQPSDNPSWDQPLNFDLEGEGKLSIQVVDQHRPGKPKVVGELMSPIEIAGDFQDTKSFKEQPLVQKAKKKSKAGTVSFTVTRLNYPDGSESVRTQMQLAGASASKVEKVAKTAGALGYLAEADETIEDAAKMAEPWKPLMKRVGILVKIGNEIAGIHPYLQMVWSVLSPALKAIEEQVKRDEEIIELLDAMNAAYDFVDLINQLRTEDLGKNRKEIIKKMLQQTYDCAWFIRNYTSHGFLGRGRIGIMSDHDSIVQKYIAKFKELKICFQDNSSVQVEIVVHRTLAVAEEIREEQILDDMAFALENRLAKQCLLGTREKIIADIVEWINRSSTSPDEPEPCVYWLHGVAGCGKSAIASTIAQRFQDVRRCVWYFFDASKQSNSGPDQMFSTLSRELADIYPEWKESLVKVAKGSRRLRKTTNIGEQFDNFVLKPAAEFDPMGPILVVIDALDESGSKEGRVQLLQTLGRLGELDGHGRFRFLITSRPEEDIETAFANKPWVVSKDLNRVEWASIDDDIRRYVDAELSQEDALMEKFQKEPVDLVVERAEHLFQWAFVACSFIRGTIESGAYAEERYIYLRDDRTDARLDKLDELYTKVLKGLYGSGEKNDKIARFRKVLGRILSAKEPLSLDTLTELRPMGEDMKEIELIVCSLGSLLKGVDRSNRQEPIQPLHASFIDFLIDPERSGDFHVKTKSEDATLAQSSLRVMNNSLRFNICDLKTSYLRNQDVENLSEQIQKKIPKHLAYGCRYFAEHLSECESNEEIFASIRELLWEKLLFWFETLSLLKNISRALMELLTLQTWIKKNMPGEKVELLVDDAIRYVRAYGGMMEMSAPHIYLSSIGLIPRNSPLHDIYAGYYPGGIQVASDGGGTVEWASMLLQIQTFEYVNAVGFSPDGKLVVSGSDDKTVRVWDAHTGQPVGHPFQGHTGYVTSVGFSHDGKLVVSGSYDSTVRVWDAYTGQPVGHPFQGHTNRVRSVGFSHNGKLVVSGSDDETVRVWDAYTGQPVGHPFQGHTGVVTSVGFSHDGKLVVSGSDDKTVRVWDAHTGQPVSHPFQGHTGYVTSVGFSHDGKLVVSGSNDSTVRVWDAYTSRPISNPLQAHADPVTSVAFSPNSNLIVSASQDSTIHVWDIDPFTTSLLPKSNSTSLMPISTPDNRYDSQSLDYAVSYTDSSKIDIDGWILGPSGQLLFWVPPTYRPNLWRPSNIAVIGPNSLKLDLSGFVHGVNWRQCRKL